MPDREAQEEQLLEELQAAKREYENASPENRPAACRKYLGCLQRFSRLVIGDRRPLDKDA